MFPGYFLGHTEFREAPRVKGSLLYLPDDIRVETERGARALQPVIKDKRHQTLGQTHRKELLNPCPSQRCFYCLSDPPCSVCLASGQVRLDPEALTTLWAVFRERSSWKLVCARMWAENPYGWTPLSQL